MDLWLGPAIISGLVSLVVVQLNFRAAIRAERLRRTEEITDFQIALRAEIRSELRNLERFDFALLLHEVEANYDHQPSYSVVVPRVTKHPVFEAIVSEIHILPESVIDPVVLYARQRQAVESLAEDIRDANFKSLSKDRQLAIYRDYLNMWETWRDFARDAEAALSGTPSIARARPGLP